ncbi:hypothetical protein BLAHAN_04428 [Blautia hansenii DSM 20583]|uniref:Uncharacterized protein n=1 Tax=Blautia hansenii DSM 20583 TaxID=537007 RepID=C9L4X9_BLAHA|nr:hypothetical protein BLAHAN_04428 [Blautia hansenii DSM 20583]
MQNKNKECILAYALTKCSLSQQKAAFKGKRLHTYLLLFFEEIF